MLSRGAPLRQTVGRYAARVIEAAGGTPAPLGVPPDPDRLDHELLTAVPFGPALVDLDLDAYLASPRVIATHSDGRWPIEGFTRAEALPLATYHEEEHRARRSFTYRLLDPAGQRSLGCLYLNPLRDYLTRVDAGEQTLATYAVGRAVMVTLWIREDRERELSAPVAAALARWLRTSWTFDARLFRALPAEHASVSALDGLGLARVDLDLPGEQRPYLWFAG